MYLTNVERLEMGLVGSSDVPEELVLAKTGAGKADGGPDFSSMSKTEISQYAKEVYGELISTSMTKDQMIVAIEAIVLVKGQA